MPEIMLAKDVRRYVIRYVRKECQKECQNRLSEEMSEDMSEKDVRRYVRKGCQKIRPKKYHKECVYGTVPIELQAPRRLKTDVATAILA